MRSPASENQRIAVRGGARDPTGPDAAATASHVFDDHGLTKGYPHTLRKNPRKSVGAATRSKWHTEGNGARRIVLRPSDRQSDPRDEKQCDSAGHQIQKLAITMKSHGASSLGSLSWIDFLDRFLGSLSWIAVRLTARYGTLDSITRV